MNRSRRSVLIGAFNAAASLYALPACSQARSDFATLFAQALADPESLEAARSLRERPPMLQALPPGHRNVRSDRKIAPLAVTLIVTCEVTNQTLYQARYEAPQWPGGNSGATIGVGYDLGYTSPIWLTEDWAGYLQQDAMDRLKVTCGKTGERAKEVIRGLKDIVVPWDAAIAQFSEHLLPLYVGETLKAVPLANNLSDKSLGALVSLAYNRGTSFNCPPDTYSRIHHIKDRFFEMRAIKSALASKEYDLIPGLIEQMTRLWSDKKYKGIVTRRRLEAQLFKEGLVST